MRLYAQTPARRSRQVLVDLVAVVLIAVTVWTALLVRDTILLLAVPGREVEFRRRPRRGTRQRLGRGGDVPFIGDVLKKPLQAAADAGTGFADAGASLQDTVTQVADATAAALIVVPVLLILVLWLPPRLLWIRRSATVRRLAEAPGGADLLALRALTGPPSALAALPTPPGGFADAWRRGDPRTVAALAALTLAHTGLRP
ncbi:hypothetical protein ACFQ60_07230 [Streptomyces zhihengii]